MIVKILACRLLVNPNQLEREIERERAPMDRTGEWGRW